MTKIKKKKLGGNNTSKDLIGYGKGVRVGNFHIYRAKISAGAKEQIDCLVLSNYSKSWRVHIPSTVPMFTWISDLYQDSLSGKEQGINMVLTNIMNVCLTARADYQYLVNCLAQIFINPEEKITKDGHEYTIVEAVCNDIKWFAEKIRDEYEADKKAEENDPEAEKQLSHDETYHAMIDELGDMNADSYKEATKPQDT